MEGGEGLFMRTVTFHVQDRQGWATSIGRVAGVIGAEFAAPSCYSRDEQRAFEHRVPYAPSG